METSRGLSGWKEPICLYAALTVSGAASGTVAGAVAHLNPLSPNFQKTWVRDARFASVAESLLVVPTIVRDIDWCPWSPGCCLLEVRTWQGVARLVLLSVQKKIKRKYVNSKTLNPELFLSC